MQVEAKVHVRVSNPRCWKYSTIATKGFVLLKMGISGKRLFDVWSFWSLELGGEGSWYAIETIEDHWWGTLDIANLKKTNNVWVMQEDALVMPWMKYKGGPWIMQDDV